MSYTIEIQEANLVGTIRPETSLKGSIASTAELRGKIVQPQVIYIGGTDNVYILTDDYGNEVAAVLSDKPVVLDATPNDIRIGKTAATGEGVTLGDKYIPAYETTEGWRAVPIGASFGITLNVRNRYDFTKLQAILCPYDSSTSSSVSAEKVVIECNVYEVKTAVSISTVSVNHDNKTIELGITNDTDRPFIIRYFTYKEE